MGTAFGETKCHAMLVGLVEAGKLAPVLLALLRLLRHRILTDQEIAELEAETLALETEWGGLLPPPKAEEVTTNDTVA